MANLYEFVRNDSVANYDTFGLSPCTDRCDQDFRNATRRNDKIAKVCAVAGGVSGGTAGAFGGLIGGEAGVVGGAIIVGAGTAGITTLVGWLPFQYAATIARGACYAGCASIGSNAP